MRNMNDLLRQANVMQNKIAKLQQEMGERAVEVSSGGGMVKVEVYCKQELKSVTIDPKALGEGADVEMLQDLIMVAANEALRQIEEMTQNEMGKLTGGMSIPGLM